MEIERRRCCFVDEDDIYRVVAAMFDSSTLSWLELNMEYVHFVAFAPFSRNHLVGIFIEPVLKFIDTKEETAVSFLR
jgi:hypothetical protein